MSFPLDVGSFFAYSIKVNRSNTIQKMSNLTSSKALPSYKKPPVNEVVCGMIFQIPEKIRITHIGLLWDRLRAEYPVVQHAVPIASSKGELLIDETTGLPIQRVWFINISDDQLVQFQFDRFYFNWRRRQSEYPRYPFVIERYEHVRGTIERFFKEHNLGELVPIELELNYINHIPKGQERDAVKDFSNIFSNFIWKQRAGQFLPDPTGIVWKTKFPIDDDMGVLNVNLRQATRTDDKTPLLVFELKARGIYKTKDSDAMRKWFDVAHEWIVRGFTDLTTSEAHNIWEREK